MTSIKHDVAFLVALALLGRLDGRVTDKAESDLLQLIYREVRDGLTLFETAVERRRKRLQPSGN
jgi:hypothetical protein